MTKLSLKKQLHGRILDIGGGGEGIIGRLYREQVTAIDIRQEELDEIPNCCTKLLMDATRLTFPSDSFDHVTAFYSLLYMLQEDQRKAIAEAARVLRPGGYLHIWDTAFCSAYPEPFVVELDVSFGRELVHTSYGIIKNEGQSERGILQMANAAGLILSEAVRTDEQFYLSFRLPPEQAPAAQECVKNAASPCSDRGGAQEADH